MIESPFEEWLHNTPPINKLPEDVVAEIRSFAEDQVDRIHELVKIGMALSAEKKLDRLLEMIISEARRFTNADGGTLYIKSEDEEALEFMIIQNDSLNVRMGGSGQQISWPKIPLQMADGKENHRNVSAHCALVGKAINIADVYNAEGFDFQGTKDFDKTTGYRSKSMLLIPMRDHEDEVIGVLQLLNAKDLKTGEVVSFPEQDITDTTSLASQAAIAITNMRLVKGLENLLDAFLRVIAAAIDEKSPYTAGHVQRVAELTEKLASVVDGVEEGEFAGVHFNSDELTEIKMAAWMHDVGKITTPEYVVDKATKLQTIFDRIELLRCRIEILKKDAEIRRLQSCLAQEADQCERPATETMVLDRDMEFLEKVNFGSEFMDEESIERLMELSSIALEVGDKKISLLDSDELNNLIIRKGTLTASERSIINNHVSVTIKMLETLPFPRKLSNVPRYAGMHHEKLDGSGYPRGFAGEEIPAAARMLAIADVFEALTAADRPYKKGKLLSESMRILEFMVKDGHLDGNLCDLMVESGLVEEYSRNVLAERQRDDFVWKGKVYKVSGEAK
ncbi:MAG: GAF domain-containing protein [Proteobacteria bacterium]|nr:GAF domain-containing protein [Pseudomonadota bacterium]MBU1714433.1 GAF domain-containing protein [Pseudomonadota bacterium]